MFSFEDKEWKEIKFSGSLLKKLIKGCFFFNSKIHLISDENYSIFEFDFIEEKIVKSNIEYNILLSSNSPIFHYQTIFIYNGSNLL